MKIALIREGKTPPDARAPMSPKTAAYVNLKPGFELVVQPSPMRCFSDQEYLDAGIQLQEDLSDCDILLGVKEVPIEELIADKTYFFFSHTIKKQSYNRDLLRAILEKRIRLIDYEVLTNTRGKRMIAFGIFAGMVGAHNAILTYGRRTGLFNLPPMHSFQDYEAAQAYYKTMKLPPIKIVLTGTGRVGNGARNVLEDMGIRRVGPHEMLTESFDGPVFCQLICQNYVARKDGKAFDRDDYYKNPGEYRSIFAPFTQACDIMINGIFWDNEAPAFFTREEMAEHDFRLKVIADVTCDIAPVSSIPSTLRASTIDDPIFGYDPATGTETAPHQKHVIDMMTVDNLPNELPRDASTSFGSAFYEFVLPELAKEHSEMLERATVAEDGKLGPHFEYLADYVAGRE